MSGAAHELEVTLRDVTTPRHAAHPSPQRDRLGDLHRVLQVAMGWQDSHLDAFAVAGERYGVPDPEWDDDTLRDEADVRLMD